MNVFVATFVIGIGATAVMDLWGFARRPLLGIAPPNYGLVGRWIMYMPRGRFCHSAIAASSPLCGEHIIGWLGHYLVGVAFAALLVGIGGSAWLQQPTIGPAIMVGIGTVAAPFLLMQPAMGAGIAGSKTPRPASTRLQSFITHLVFGFGLFATGKLINAVFIFQ